MNSASSYPSILLASPGSQRRLGASADHLARLYYERPAFRTLWDDYVVCRLGLLHWESHTDALAPQRCLEYAQNLQDLEHELRKHIERSWDLVEDTIAPIVFGTASAILRELRAQHGLRGREVYLAPLFPLIEMAWLGQRPQANTIAFIRECGHYVCQRLGRLAGGQEVLDESQLQRFLSRFLCGESPSPALAHLSRLGLAFLRAHDNPALVKAREKAIWRCCLQLGHHQKNRSLTPAQQAFLNRLAPSSMSHQDIQTLARSDVTRLMSELEHAWACA